MFYTKKIKALQEEVYGEKMMNFAWKNAVYSQEITIKDLNDEIEELKAKYVMLKKKYAEVVEDNFRMAEKLYEMSKGAESDGKR